MKAELVRTFMKRWGLSVAALADYLRVNPTILADALNPARRSKLSQLQENDIKEYLGLLNKELVEFLESDLEQLPEAMELKEE